MKKKDNRVAALARFAAAITVLNIVGHLYLGFEQSYAHVFVALLTGYSLELFIEIVRAKLDKRQPGYSGGISNFIIFLLPAHITSLAVSMLTFTNEDLMGVVFAVAVGIFSKIIFRVNFKGRSRHFLNPSNTGIAVSFLVFPWIGVAPPYQFSESTSGIWDWVLVIIFVSLGSFLNYKFTKKIPLIVAWLGMFFIQAVVRTSIFGTDTLAAIAPMSGVAFLLFTFYMVSDPSTTPFKKTNQIIFGSSVAVVYGILMELHIVFNMFFALLIVCTARGLYMWISDMIPETQAVDTKQAEPINVLKELEEKVNQEPELVS